MTAKPSQQTIAKTLLDQYGTTFAQELHISIESNTPSPLFRLLCAALLFSARIQESIATEAIKALAEQGWTTPQKLLESSWEARAKCLNEAGYARYDERTATMLGDATQLLVDRYNGDLRQLRQAADYDPRQEHQLLTEFKGIGKVGANIFLREVQAVWEEVFPFADDRILRTAKELDLPDDVDALLDLVGDRDFPRLVAALVRVRLAHEQDELKEKINSAHP